MSFRSLYAFGFVVLVMGAVPCVVAAPAEGEVRPWLVRIHEAAGHAPFITHRDEVLGCIRALVDEVDSA